MIKLINRLTGTVMWVADERKEEYLAAGHKLAAEVCVKPAIVADEEKPEVVTEELQMVAPKKTTKARRKK